jgi:hypothetical protein
MIPSDPKPKATREAANGREELHNTIEVKRNEKE